MSNSNEELRVVPVFKSLVRPQLLAGGDRTLVIVLLCICGLLIGPGGFASTNPINCFLGIVTLILGLRLLNVLAKYDPYAFQVLRRTMLYSSLYPAQSEYLCKTKWPKKK